jgi:multimeric flavodoxin WrbA
MSKILILNGSPKANKSVSLFYAKYLVKQFPEINFQIQQVSSQIKMLEKDGEKFNELVSEIRKAEGIIWTTPVYVLSVPGQVIRFFELLRQRCEPDILKGKYVSAICTSMHFFDHNALFHLQAETESLEGSFIDGFSAEMFDIQKTEVKRNIKIFANVFFSYISDKRQVSRRFSLNNKIGISQPKKYTASIENIKKIEHSNDIVLISNTTEKDNNINEMIKLFNQKMGNRVHHILLHDVAINGGCIGCLQCSQKGKCIYKDEYEQHKEKIKNADALIYALNIENHSFGSRFKYFADRNFSNGHRIKANFYTGFLISGNLSQAPIAQNMIDGINYGGKSSFEGNVVCDEYERSEEIDKLIEVLCENLIQCIDHKYQKSANFYGVSAHKIFRDLIYSTSGFQREDDRYYKKNGLYDFPTRDYKTRFRNLIFKMLTSNKPLKEKFNKKINVLILEQLEKEIT